MSLNYVQGPATATVDNTIVRWDGTTGRLVQGSTVSVSDNGDIVQPSTATQGHRLYNTVDQATNTEYFECVWATNVATVRTVKAGTGVLRSLAFSVTGAVSLTLGSNGVVSIAAGLSTAAGAALDFTNSGVSFGASSGAQYGIRYAATVNQSGTASFDMLLLNPTLTAVGSNGGTFFRAQSAGSDRYVVDTNGSVSACAGTAIPAGGTAGRGLKVSSTANFGIFFGSGAPTLSAAKGSLYLRSDGTGTTDRAYINTDGGTTWTALTTVA